MKIVPAPKSPESVDAEISALVKRLNSENEQEVRLAIAQLTKRGDVGVEVLLTTLTVQEKQRKRNIRLAIARFIATSAVAFPLGAAFDLPFLMPICTFFTGAFLFQVMLSPSQKHAAKWLAQLEDVRAVGFLTETLQWKNTEIRESATYGLIRILPRLSANYAHYLTLKHRQILLDQFGRAEPPLEFRLAILKAMEQVGGAEAIPQVFRLAKGEGRFAQDSALKQAAIECLPYLQARAEGRELRDTLLRSSSAAEVAPDTLLRPAPSTSEEPANELLRPRE